MSERRRRSPNPGGGEQPPGGGGRPYAYGTPAEGAPSYDGPGEARGRTGPEGLRSEGIGRRRPPGTRETAQQPRMTRAEMRKAAQKGGKGGGPSGPQAGQGGKPGKKRFIDYPRFGKTGVRRWLPSWKQLLTMFLLVFGSGVATIGVVYATTKVPNPHDLIKDQNNIYYWADGSEMTRKGETNRQIVELPDISMNAQNAVIAAENESFRSDSGVDPKGMLRAVYNMATGGETQGASTITQQYVKNAYLSQEQTLSRKVDEFFITLKLNQDKSKEFILTGYLNTSWFGRGATGIQAASQAYYGVDAKNLDVCQSAMLAGLLKGAALYDPSLSPANEQRAEGRWKWILDRMVITKAITQEERNKCAAFPKPIDRKPPANMNGEISYLVDTANKFVTTKDPTITQAAIDRGGFKIYTTFEKDKVDALKKAVDDVKGETLNLTKRPEQDNFVQFGAASVKPGDGAIVAIYGGDGVENKHFDNNADSKGVQVGSTFKPIVLATAMQNGVLTQTDDQGRPKRINAESRYLSDDLAEIRKSDGSLLIGDDGKPYRQKNEDAGKRGYVSLRQAMQWSYNVPFVQLGQDVGGQNVADMAQKLGLKKESLTDPKTATFPLGTSSPSAIRMASAYSTFAASGKQADPYSVTKVEVSGKELPGFTKPAVKQAIDAAVADNVTDVLVNVAKNGTGMKSNALGRPVAGKTGTTDKNHSAWWVGYTPQLATSVAMWREDPTAHVQLSLNGTGGKDSVHGGDVPTDIFTRYMKAALANEPKVSFPAPEPIGSQLDSSGAPSTAVPSMSASATETAPPTTAPETVAPPVTQPSPSAPSCVVGVDCPGTVPTPTPTRTQPGGGNGGGNGGGGQPTCLLGPIGCQSPSATTPTQSPTTGPTTTRPPKPSASSSSPTGSQAPAP